MSTQDLLPCPFCGGEANFLHDPSYDVKQIECSSCTISTGHFMTASEAIAAWNRRISPSATDPLVTLIQESVRFSVWAAGEGIRPANGELARCPDDFVYEYIIATGDEDTDTLPNRAASLLAIPPDPTAPVPDGYVLVPKEPTEEMIESAARACFALHLHASSHAWLQHGYRAMISAAPPAPAIETAAPGGQQEAMALIRWAHDTLYEINPSNYDHDEVCRLNDASVEVLLAFAQFLGEPRLTDGDDPAPAAPTEGSDE